MSEIRDRAQGKIAEAIFLGEQKQVIADLEKEAIISGTKLKYKVLSWEKQPAKIKAIYLKNADEILSIPELAIVGRGAWELGANMAYYLGLEGGVELFKDYPDNFNRIIHSIAEKLSKAGWAKEIKQ